MSLLDSMKSPWALLCAIGFGAFVGGFAIPGLFRAAEVGGQLFINALRLLSLPVIFLSIVSTLSSMSSGDEMRHMTVTVLRFSLPTTVFSATVAAVLFFILDPVGDSLLEGHRADATVLDPELGKRGAYMDFLVKSLVPDNLIQAFLDGNVLGVAVVATAVGFTVSTLKAEQRDLLRDVFRALFTTVLRITSVLVSVMPIGVFAFTAIFAHEMHLTIMRQLGLYLTCVLGANVIQGCLVLPAVLLANGISPMEVFRAVIPALSVAFFSKSSNATLPTAMKCVEERLQVPEQVSSFSLPLCAVVNMNGCAAFIYTTVLFVAISNGITFSLMERIVWIFIASLAAVGNAGIPMGCFFLSSALLSGMNVSLSIMGVILPVYTLIDMVETALNIWSDCCVTALVAKTRGHWKWRS